MRIGIGAILGVLGGPATYARELIRALVPISGHHELTVITDDSSTLAEFASQLRVVTLPIGAAWRQAIWDQRIPPISRRERFDVYHGTKGILPLFGSTPMVVTIHDLAVYRQPHTFALSQRWHQRLLLPPTVHRAARIIADSEHARQDLIAEFSLEAARVCAIPLAVSPIFSSTPGANDPQLAAALDLPDHFLLYAGTLQPRKRVDLLIEAFAGLSQANHLQLLIAGRVRPGYRPAFLERLPERVRYLGPVTEQQLAVLYRRALAFCSPSSYEGFGLSVLEAMQSGCPVIAAHNSSLPEVGGDTVLWLDQLNAGSIRTAFERLIGAAHLRADLRARALERARSFSWASTAQSTLAVYEEVARATR